MELTNYIIFIGGIHGVGKGTICKEIASKTDIIHITASEIIKWNEIPWKQKTFSMFMFDSHFSVNLKTI